MNRSDKHFLIALGTVLVILAGCYAGLVAYTGFSAPFSVVMSQSMQHSQTVSEIGIIDTGDVVIVQDPSKAEIQSYVDGTLSGYQTFGDYGSVIIYERGNGLNPVIHRAILWLEYDPVRDTWSAPSLKDYEGTWSSISLKVSDDGKIEVQQWGWNELRGTLTLENITVSGKTVSIDLDTLEKHSGFLTMGDNVNNSYFDQVRISGVVGDLVTLDDIRSIPIFEIPWLGTLKILVGNNGDNLEYVTNSLPSLLMCIICVFALLLLLDGVALYRNQTGIRYRLSRMRECSRR